MNSYLSYVNNRIKPLTEKGGLLYQFTNQAASMYKEAENLTAQKYTSKMAFNAYPLDRYLLANERLYELALNHDECMPKQKSNGYGNYRTEVNFKDIVLTISQVRNPGEMVRSSTFRQEFAEKFNRTLFNPVPKIPQEDDTIYGIILHGPMSPQERNIGFLNIAVPDDSLDGYGYNRNLYKFCGIKQPYELEKKEVEKRKELETPSVTLKKEA
mgnify:CR=1 FL=1